jgi:hypothetical protein
MRFIQLFIGLLALAGQGAASDDRAGTARLIPISDAAFAGSSVNVVANVRQSVFTHGGAQFAAFYDADRTGEAAPTPIGLLVWRPAADRAR